MIAFDTDVLTEILLGNTTFVQRAAARVRIATHDLRIAATCVAHAAKLISRNRRDFERVPGLIVEFWE